MKSQYVPGKVPSTLLLNSHPIFLKTLWEMHFSYTHLIQKETKAQRGTVCELSRFTQLVTSAGDIGSWTCSPEAVQVTTSRPLGERIALRESTQLLSFLLQSLELLSKESFDCSTAWVAEWEWNVLVHC